MFVLIVAILIFVFLNALLVMALNNKSKTCEFEFTFNVKRGISVKLKTNKKDAPQN